MCLYSNPISQTTKRLGIQTGSSDCERKILPTQPSIIGSSVTWQNTDIMTSMGFYALLAIEFRVFLGPISLQCVIELKNNLLIRSEDFDWL